MAPAGKDERFGKVVVVPQGLVPALCPLLPFLAHTSRRVLSSGFLRRTLCSGAGRAIAGSKRRSMCLAVCDGGRGKGEGLHGSHEDSCGMCAVEVAGVCVCACAWLKWGTNSVTSEKDGPAWEVLSRWLALRWPSSSAPSATTCYLQNCPHGQGHHGLTLHLSPRPVACMP